MEIGSDVQARVRSKKEDVLNLRKYVSVSDTVISFRFVIIEQSRCKMYAI